MYSLASTTRNRLRWGASAASRSLGVINSSFDDSIVSSSLSQVETKTRLFDPPQQRYFSQMALIKELRSQSNAPIVDCKKALDQCSADDSSKEDILQSAMDWLREHGSLKVSSKLQGRDAMEGLIGIALSDDQLSGAIVKVSSETDFASRSDTFGHLVTEVSRAVLTSALLSSSTSTCNDLAQETILKASSSADEKKTVDDLLKEAIVSIRENISIPSAITMQVPPPNNDDQNGGGFLVGYIHGRITPTQDSGTSAAMVYLSPQDKDNTATTDDMREIGKKLAMHIVAAKPQYLSQEDVPQEIIQKETDLLQGELAVSGKKPEIVEKIITGRLQKNLYQQVCLLDQPHMIEEKNPKVSKVLQDSGLVLKHFQAMWINA